MPLDGTSDSEPEDVGGDETPERRERAYYVAAKMVWEASKHVAETGMGPIDFALGFRALLTKTPEPPLPLVCILWLIVKLL